MSPTCFDWSVSRVIEFAHDCITTEAHQKQLYYHNLGHAAGVLRRAERIFTVVRPYWDLPEATIERWHQLLKIGAIAHDMVQLFLPSFQLYVPRRQQAGMSEQASIDLLFDFIDQLNQQVNLSGGCFLNSDKAILRQAIQATTYVYDGRHQAIIQPYLYENPNLSPVARILALADLGTLGMDGINAFNQAGSLMFLEKNPDIISVIQSQRPEQTTSPEHLYSIRQRLLKQARFQIDFAHSRLIRTWEELSGLPPEAIPELQTSVFKYLIADTADLIENTTPTANDTTLETLLAFFNFPIGPNALAYEVFPGLGE